MTQKIVIFVLYDSVTNSIFEGQILTPLLKKITQEKCLIHIISFERTLPSLTLQKFYQQYQPALTIHFIKRMPFLGTFSLFFESKQLQTLLKNFESYTLIARGPLAALCAYQTSFKKCTSFILQARGLLAEEYRYTHKNSSFNKYIIHTLRAYQLAYYEKKAYTSLAKLTCIARIETVSQALSKYLSEQFLINQSYFTQAIDDIPTPIPPTKKNNFRTAIRKELNISPKTCVYVYNGSAKPWQCPQETMLYFKKCYAKNNQSFLLLLTQDILYFEQLCMQLELPKNSYRILHVPHTAIMPYLCASDVGIILREKHIINWIARPTKVLEYQAAHLSIYHNNTLALLTKNN